MSSRTYTVDRYAHRFHIEVNDAIMETHYQKGELCEYHMLDWIEKNVPRGGVWIDAGANVGNHALPFCLWADRVVCFEPMRVNFDMLQRNLDTLRVMYPHLDKAIPLRMGLGRQAKWVGAEKGGTGQNCQWELRGSGSLPVVALDHIIPYGEPVRLIKLDVEGMEEDALIGAIGILGRHKPELFIEIWDEAVLASIQGSLAKWGYTLIERWNVAPTFHFSASGRYPVTYTPAERLRP